MRSAYDFAKYFIQHDYDTISNTFDGNMKLQKLLVFAYLISLAKYNRPLFEDDILAFKNGFVVESVRLKYQHDYYALKKESDLFEPDFSDEENDILKQTVSVYGSLSATELSDLSHEFDFWRVAYNRGLDSSGYHDKEKSKIELTAMMSEIQRIQDVLEAHEQSKRLCSAFQSVNGIKFFYTPQDVQITDDLIEYLDEFTETADDTAYSIYYDDGELVVY